MLAGDYRQMFDLFKQRYQPQIATSIAHKAKFQLQTESVGHKFNENWRLFRRELSLLVSGQKFLERRVIPAETRSILWLAPSIKNIGDAVMALSGRELLIKAGYVVDVLVDAKVYPLFKSDQWFNQVASKPQELADNNYDLILLDSVKSISLKTKQKYFKKTPYCHFRGHFDGVEFNWILFSYHRINALLENIYQQEQLDMIARPALFPRSPESGKIRRLVIATGGEDQLRRVYDKWNEVIAGIRAQIAEMEIVLVGNANAVADARILAEQFGDKVINLVNQLSLSEVAELISQSTYFAGCDGGLMHIAVAHELAGVALFGYFEPEYRLPLTSGIKNIYDMSSVKNILPETIVSILIDTIMKKEAND